MDFRLKLLSLLVLFCLNIALTWAHFSIDSPIEVKYFKNEDAFRNWLSTELINLGIAQNQIRYQSVGESFQRFTAQIDYNKQLITVSDINLALQKKLASYDVAVHGRVDLINNRSTIHLIAKSTILGSLTFQPIDSDQ